MSASGTIVRAVLDANVLFPMTLCDTLLRMAEQGLYIPLWSDTILDEMERNLVLQRRTTAEGAHNRRLRMDLVFSGAMVTGYERLIPAMTNHPKDRHVLAAAAHAGADVIVTQNRRDFPDAALVPHGVTAQSADAFLQAVLGANLPGAARLIAEQAAGLQRKPVTAAHVLDGLQTHAPVFVRTLREWMRAQDSSDTDAP